MTHALAEAVGERLHGEVRAVDAASAASTAGVLMPPARAHRADPRAPRTTPAPTHRRGAGSHRRTRGPTSKRSCSADATPSSLVLDWTAAATAAAASAAVHVCDAESGGCGEMHDRRRASGRSARVPPGRNFTVRVEAFNALGASGNASAAPHTPTASSPRARAPMADIDRAAPRLNACERRRCSSHGRCPNGSPVTASPYSRRRGAHAGRHLPAASAARSHEYLQPSSAPVRRRTITKVAAQNALGMGGESAVYTHVTADAAAPPGGGRRETFRSARGVGLGVGAAAAAAAAVRGETLEREALRWWR